ncbi:hypothetical protein HK104_002710 [Borealophlyctis nickersoniae]|nr:hypothetical protein HK104_002710 [Borealophlyctis nickersoniae]
MSKLLELIDPTPPDKKAAAPAPTRPPPRRREPEGYADSRPLGSKIPTGLRLWPAPPPLGEGRRRPTYEIWEPPKPKGTLPFDKSQPWMGVLLRDERGSIGKWVREEGVKGADDPSEFDGLEGVEAMEAEGDEAMRYDEAEGDYGEEDLDTSRDLEGHSIEGSKESEVSQFNDGEKPTDSSEGVPANQLSNPGDSDATPPDTEAASKDSEPDPELWKNILIPCCETPESYPDIVVKYTDDIVIIKHQAPKAEHHYLVMPRRIIPNGLEDLGPGDLGLLVSLKDAAYELIQKWNQTLKPPLEFSIGFHSVPQFRQLHMHVISPLNPFSSTKTDWNSFKSRFFRSWRTVFGALESVGRIEVKPLHEAELLNTAALEKKRKQAGA